MLEWLLLKNTGSWYSSSLIQIRSMSCCCFAGKSHHKSRPLLRKSPNKLQVIGCYRRVCLVEKEMDLPCLSLFKKQADHGTYILRENKLPRWTRGFLSAGSPLSWLLTAWSDQTLNATSSIKQVYLQFTLFWRDYGLLVAILTNLQVCQTCFFMVKTCQNTSKPACINPWIKITLPSGKLSHNYGKSPCY